MAFMSTQTRTSPLTVERSVYDNSPMLKDGLGNYIFLKDDAEARKLANDLLALVGAEVSA